MKEKLLPFAAGALTIVCAQMLGLITLALLSRATCHFKCCCDHCQEELASDCCCTETDEACYTD